MKHQNKKWYNVTIASRDGSKVFDGGTSAYTIMAKVQSKGNAYTVAKALEAVYKPEYYIIVVE